MGAPEDRVRVYKDESPGTGGTQDDGGMPALSNPNQDGISVRGIFLQKYVAPGNPIEEDELVYVTRDDAGNMVFRDIVDGTERTLSDLLSGAGGGITEGQHEELDTLTHALTETHDIIPTRINGKISEVLAEETGGTDIRKTEVLTRDSRGRVATFRVTQYEADGITAKRVLDYTVNRSGRRVSSINVVRST